jgi:serine/threonine protein kinase
MSAYIPPKRCNTDSSKIFLEYCPYGDGADMMHHHLMLNSRNRQQNSYVPEPAIWCMFDSLMKAGLAMEQELEAEPQQLFETRELGEVIHLDIKPGNVFFGDYPEDDSINFAMYPTCKLGDFRGAIYRRLALQSQPTDPNRFLDRGTPGFFALEQKSRYYGQHRPALNPKTNVWAVGITVMAFMNLDFSTGLLAFTEAANKNKSDPRLVPSFTPEAMARYSSVLRDMVRACVQYEQKKRPGFRALLDASRNHTGLAPRFRDLAHGARFGTRHSIPAGLTLLSGLPTDKYALGMAMPA